MTVVSLDEIKDGRERRRFHSRRIMLNAGLRLVEKGQFRFTPLEIASAAKMHRRSFFDIFGTHDAYLEALSIEHEASLRVAIQSYVKAAEDRSVVRLVLLGR
jgi:hypothetical protein